MVNMEGSWSDLEMRLLAAANPEIKLNNLPEHFAAELNNVVEHTTVFHLAVWQEPFLKYLLEGKKTMESRFSKKEVIPYKKVHTKDLVFVKQSSGPVLAAFQVGICQYYPITKEIWPKLQGYSKQLAVPEGFWFEHRDKKFVSLIHIEKLIKLTPVNVVKKDQRSWIVL